MYYCVNESFSISREINPYIHCLFYRIYSSEFILFWQQLKNAKNSLMTIRKKIRENLTKGCHIIKKLLNLYKADFYAPKRKLTN
jgi:hypothetical protein